MVTGSRDVKLSFRSTSWALMPITDTRVKNKTYPSRRYEDFAGSKQKFSHFLSHSSQQKPFLFFCKALIPESASVCDKGISKINWTKQSVPEGERLQMTTASCSTKHPQMYCCSNFQLDVSYSEKTAAYMTTHTCKQPRACYQPGRLWLLL